MKFEATTFLEQAVPLDGNEFIECHFENCSLVYSGGLLPDLLRCSFINVTWSFSDGAARMVEFMACLYHSPSEGATLLVEQTFEQIRAGTIRCGTRMDSAEP